jgi:hypothetical protein
MKHLFAALMFCVLSSAASAGETAETVVEKWYAALASADRAAFEKIIADDAVITLTDLETDQNKQDFMVSLDEWEDALKGASIRHRIESATAESASVLVCYKFPNNEALGRETFRVKDGKVAESIQTTIGDSCAEF